MTGNRVEPFDSLIDSLKGDGLIEEAEKLRDMLHDTAWTSFSELYGELGLAMKAIKSKTGKRFSVETHKCFDESAKLVKRIWPNIGLNR